MSSHRSFVAAGVLVLSAMTACGQEAAGPTEVGEDAQFDPTAATLTDQRFCDDLDAELIAGVLGMAPDELTLVEDRQIGDTFEPVEGMGLKTAEANICAYGSQTRQLSVLVEPDASVKDVEKSIRDLEALKGDEASETCAAQDAAGLGDPAGAFVCRAPEALGGARAAAVGMVGDSKFYCTAMAPNETETLEATAVDACRSILETLAGQGS